MGDHLNHLLHEIMPAGSTESGQVAIPLGEAQSVSVD